MSSKQRLDELAEAVVKMGKLLTATVDKTAAHELVLGALLRHQSEETLRAMATELEETFQGSFLQNRESIKEATRGVWKTAGRDWEPSGTSQP